MAAIFISYARQSADMATSLSNDMKMFGYEVWFDRELSGGQAWWDHILTSIRRCDIFVFLLTPDSLESTACRRECNYADALGKPILPVLVADNVSIPRLPPMLSQIHFVDSRQIDRESLLQLWLALRKVPPPGPEPDPLPDPPPVPLSYLGALAEQIASDMVLTREQQSALVISLRRAIDDPNTAADAYQLLQQLRQRHDLLANIAVPIDEALASYVRKEVRPGTLQTSVESFKRAVSRVQPLVSQRIGTWVQRSIDLMKQAVATGRLQKLSTKSRVGIALIGLILVLVLFVPNLWRWLGLPGSTMPQTLTVKLPDNINMEFVRIPAGEFMMGSNDGYSDEKPVHRVTISEPFYMGKYEVTQAQWKAVMGTNPSVFTGDPNRPVENVTRKEVQEFIKRLNRQEGWEACRLPTEAQWEYAARAGITTKWDQNDLDQIAWYEPNSDNRTHKVGQKRPNAWGLYDMLGNVMEWCHDGKRTYTHESVMDPIGPTDTVHPTSRGGSWRNSANPTHNTYRDTYGLSFSSNHLGFRCSTSGPNG